MMVKIILLYLYNANTSFMGFFFSIIGYIILGIIILAIFGIAIYWLIITVMALIGGLLVLRDRIKKGNSA